MSSGDRPPRVPSQQGEFPEEASPPHRCTPLPEVPSDGEQSGPQQQQEGPQQQMYPPSVWQHPWVLQQMMLMYQEHLFRQQQEQQHPAVMPFPQPQQTAQSSPRESWPSSCLPCGSLELRAGARLMFPFSAHCALRFHAFVVLDPTSCCSSLFSPTGKPSSCSVCKQHHVPCSLFRLLL